MVGSPDRSKGAEGDLYEGYVKPLEQTHWGEYVAVSRTGDTVVGADLMEVVQKATDSLGPGSEVFNVGERVVGRWR